MMEFLACIGGLTLVVIVSVFILSKGNVHIFVGSDEDARDWHAQNTVELDALIKEKASRHTNESKP